MNADAAGLSQRVRESLRQANAMAAASSFDGADRMLAELLAIDDEHLICADEAITREILNVAGALLPSRLWDPLEKLIQKVMGVFDRHEDRRVYHYFAPRSSLVALYESKGLRQEASTLIATMVFTADRLEGPIDGITATIFSHLVMSHERAEHWKALQILYRHLCLHAFTSPEATTETRVMFAIRYCHALTRSGEADRALNTGEETIGLLENDPGFTASWRLRLLEQMIETARRKKDWDRTEALHERARDLLERSDLKDSEDAQTIYHNLATLYVIREKRERYEDAVMLLGRARDIVARVKGTGSAEYADETYQIAAVLQTKGEVERALGLYREAFAVYERAANTDPRRFSECLSNVGFTYLKRGDPASAIPLFRRARELLGSIAGADALSVANAISNLATAHFAQLEFRQAIALYEQAIEIRHGSSEFQAKAPVPRPAI